MNTLMQKLNDEQKRAALSVEGALLVLAGAGSGKTRVVTFRIAHMLESGIPPHKILGLTFTNKAAAEMKSRVHELTMSHVLICTFHSLGVRILRESIQHLGFTRDFTIYDEDDSLKLLKNCMEELQITNKKLEPKAFRYMISQAKNQMKMPDSVADVKPETEIEALFSKVYVLYSQKLKEYNAVDFDDLLFLPVRLFREFPDVLEYYQQRFSYLLIDEYQDTNASQYELARQLVRKSGNIFVVGDPDQSIYSWRGADISNILNFEKDYPGATVIRLEENYRSRTNILKAANAVISNNENRYEKKLWSSLGAGDKIKYYTASSEREEASFIAERIRDYHENKGIPLNQMVVFYRTHAQSRAFEDHFVSRRIPYIIVGGISFYQRREIKDILAFLRVVYSNTDFISFLRTINLPKRGFGDASLEKIQRAATLEEMAVISYLEATVDGAELKNILKLTSKQLQGLKDYVGMIRALRQIAKVTSLGELVKSLIEQSGYLIMLKEDPETYADRKENLDALIAKAFEWEITAEEPTLGAFLEELSLKQSLDETEDKADVLSLMTLHNGKGLEFKVTFLVGMEEDLFPHVNSRESRQQLEEERRLCYVGMTRAKEYLYLTNCMQRYIWGTSRIQRPSRFIREIPSEYIEKVRSAINKPFQQERHSNHKPEVKFIDDMDQSVPDFEEQESFVTGDAVYHNDFGVGVIRQISDTSVGKTFRIHFSKDNRERSIVAKYAHLKKL
jgi:DNA helicase-2/ATP-dependent DNA helicase PcrA